MSIVICKLPNAGLGNQLFPLMHSMVFAQINHLPLKIIGYHQIKIGPYLRNEKSKRNYADYFLFQHSIFREMMDKIKCQFYLNKYERIDEPELKKINREGRENKVFLFSKLPSYKDYFIHLRDHRDLVKELLMSNLTSTIKSKLELSKLSDIGVHVRMGDFRKLSTGENFKGGHVRMPEQYFVNTIHKIRQYLGFDIPVSVFTDGYQHEFNDLIKMNAITVEESKIDIVDLLNLSKCKLIITSQGSTFSYWAGFLSNAAIVHHPEHMHVNLRNENGRFYEGDLDMKNVQLLSVLHECKTDFH